jgi:hypothetical protein
MLIYLQCDKFVSNGETRPAIEFTPGLNVVRGSDNASNSIGKSTFLMVIDFAFGGRDYLDETKVKDLADEVGTHTIKFAFEFGDRRYYFARNTETPTVVSFCNESFETESEQSLSEYLEFLKEQYRINLEGLSFRDVVSGYQRIYHRENYSETRPLKSFDLDTPTNGIDRLLKLFDLYAPILELKKAYDESEEKKKLYSKSQKHGLFPAKLKKAEITDKQEQLEELRQQMTSLTESQNQNLLQALDLDPTLMDRAYELTGRLSSLQYQRRRLQLQMRELETNMGFGHVEMTENFDELAHFFKGVDLPRIEEIEGFHRKIQTILNKQLNEAHDELLQLIAIAEQEISAVGSEITEAELPKRATKAFWDKIRSLDSEIRRIDAELRSQEDADRIAAEAKAAKEALKTKEAEQTQQIQASTEEKLSALNDYVYAGSKQAPTLEIASPSKYEFYTPKDGGTGTAYCGLILFDISVLSLTDLPILTHDSFLFKNIEDEAIEKIMELYAREIGKQVFIAIDKVSTYSPQTQKIIAQATRLTLSKGGNELFGRPWDKKEETEQ